MLSDPLTNKEWVDCGSTYWTNDQVRSALKAQHPDHLHIDDIEFGAVDTR